MSANQNYPGIPNPANPPTTAAPPQPVYPGNYPATAPQHIVIRQSRGHGWIVAVVLILCISCVAALGVYSCSRAMAGVGLMPETMQEGTVAVINLDGSIAYDGSTCSPEGFSKLLRQANDNPKIAALVLRVNSVGGSAAAGEEMADALKAFSKPVVVSTAAINASAAYEISSQANYIYVAEASEVGSIGCAIELMDYSGLMDLLGIDTEVITSGDSKDSSYGLRPLTEDERKHYQAMVDQINESFVRRVAEGRSMKVEDVKALANGLTYTGTDAVANGLADAIGTRDDALGKAASLAGLDSYYIYEAQNPVYGFEDMADYLPSVPDWLDFL